MHFRFLVRRSILINLAAYIYSTSVVLMKFNFKSLLIRLVVTGLLISFSSIGFSQQMHYKQITVDDGLPSNTVYRVLQDKNGFIWICSDAGVSRFDGKTFLNFGVKDGLPDNEMIKMQTDGRGRIWCISLKGKLACIENGKIQPIARLQKRISGKVVDIQPCQDNCTLFFSENDSIFHVEGYEVSNVMKSDFDLSFNYATQFDDKRGNKINIWPSYYDIMDSIGLNIFNHKTLQFYSASKRLRKKQELQPEDHLFFHSFRFCLYSKGEFYDFDSDTSLTQAKIKTYLRLNNEEIMLGTLNGVLHYAIENGQLVLKNRFFPGIKISSILQDKEGNLLFSTLGDGLIICNNKGLLHQEETKNAKLIKIIYNSDLKRLYYGDENGNLGILNTETRQVKTIRFSDETNRILTLQQLKDTLLVVFDDEAVLLDKEGKLISKLASAARGLKAGLMVGHYAWIGSWYSLSKVDIKSRTEKIINFGRTMAVYLDSEGQLWFSGDNGLMRLKNDKVEDFSKKNLLLTERFVKIERDKSGNLWLASQAKGLVCFNPQKGTVFNIGSKNGLADDICNSFLLDGNKIWVATNSGIGKITFRPGSLANYNIQNISVKQGLPSNSIRDLVRVNDYFYVATSKGLAYFREQDVSINKFAPPIYVTGVKIWDQDTVLQKSYTLPYDKNNLKITFVGLAYKALGDVKYLYKMEGVDRGWIETSSNDVSYPSLPTGNYVFMVKAINEDGVQSSQPARLKIVIKAPYWQTWWFWLLLALVAGAIVYLIVYYRFKALRIQNSLLKQLGETEQKALRSQMNPHFVFNALNSIQRYIVQNEGEMAYNYLNKFGRLIRGIFQNSSRKSISLKEEIDTLQLYLELESLRFSEGFDFELDVDESVDQFNQEIPSMIIQPFIENSIWHGLMHKATRGKLYIGIKAYGAGITCIIQDNGIGREAAAKYRAQSSNHKSSAMALTAHRLKILTETTGNEHSVKVFDLLDENGVPLGTRVELQLAFVL